MPPQRATIQSLWIGPTLSTMEQLSISSFLASGHPYHLYTYGEISGVPRGAEVRDGNEILPASRVFRYRDFDTYAGFANFFRYRLLLEKGGWWCDADIICLRPFDFGEPYVFATEPVKGHFVVTNAVLKAPAESQLAAFLWQCCERKDPQTLGWGETGPRLLAEAVNTLSLDCYVQPSWVFCPLRYDHWEKLLDPKGVRLPNDVFAVHFWNEMWRRAGRSKDRTYSSGCLYEKLKRRFLSAKKESRAAPRNRRASR